MNDQLRAYFDEQANELDASVRQALEITNGDALSALRMVVMANTFLHEENDQLRQQISTGFSRGQVRKPVPKAANGKC